MKVPGFTPGLESLVTRNPYPGEVRPRAAVPRRTSRRLRLWIWLITGRHPGSSVYLPCPVETSASPIRA